MNKGVGKKSGSSEKGMALVLTLMILVLITAMVVEFAYGVYTSTSALYNWRDSQRLSFVAKSGVSMAVTMISETPAKDLYKYLGKQIPLENMSEGFRGRLIIKGEDENSKFNLNSLRRPDSVQVFKRLLNILNLDEEIAGRVAQWIGAESDSRLRGSEESAKKNYMDSVDELLYIKGIDRRTYEKLLPYVTVYGYGGTDDLRMNMNTASIPVIMSLADISKEDAEKIMNYRERQSFKEGQGELANIGFGNIPASTFTLRPPVNFRIVSIGEENKIRRVIESVVKIDGGNQIRYWREM